MIAHFVHTNLIGVILPFILGLILSCVLKLYFYKKDIDFACTCGGRYHLMYRDDTYDYYECDHCSGKYKIERKTKVKLK